MKDKPFYVLRKLDMKQEIKEMLFQVIFEEKMYRLLSLLPSLHSQLLALSS